MNKVCKYSLAALPVIIGFYGVSLSGAGILSKAINPRITSQTHLEKILPVERRSAGINDDVLLEILINQDIPRSADVIKLDDKKYRISISANSLDLGTLRHELYHVGRGHCHTISTMKSGVQRAAYKTFIAEPQAMIYEVFGIKL